MRKSLLLIPVLAYGFSIGAAMAGDLPCVFNNGDTGRECSHSTYEPPYQPAKPTKYGQYLFDGVNGAPVERRTEKTYTGQPDAAIASAQCDWALNGTNAPSFGKCAKERGGERILDKDGSNYSAGVRETNTVLTSACDIWHFGCGSGQ
jgi:hypothetical protein